ncbi:MAG TPA: S49 family peptidase [Candidatus Saccharimonadales bacterium]|nr:S49 family peptidase [Candidatus Saccharimonadales bacterium]
MPVVPVHHTATVDVRWDGDAEEGRLAEPLNKALGTGMYAWWDPAGVDTDGDDGYPDSKADWKFPHHAVSANGKPGAANENACGNILARVGASGIAAGDQADVKAHAQAHLDDAEKDEPGSTAAGATPTESAPSPRGRYAHVARAVFERPWALQPSMLKVMADLLRFRVAGGVLSPDDLANRLAAAKAQNGDRAGGVAVGPVAVIPLYGVISQRSSMMSDTSGGTSIDEARQSLRAALRDPQVLAIVFDIDSPGGAVDGVPEFAAELRSLRNGAKPIVAQVDTLCASAAYWLAANMTEIVCTPSGEVGSIGVFAVHEDISAADEMAGVKVTYISAGPFKVEGNPDEPLAEPARAYMQGQVDTFYGMFLGDVAKGRGVTVDAIAATYGQGRTLLARKAQSAGMVDRIDTLEGTIARLTPAVAAGKQRARSGSVIPVGRAAFGTSWNQRMHGLVKAARR